MEDLVNEHVGTWVSTCAFASAAAFSDMWWRSL
jgi:hypothetical protein